MSQRLQEGAIKQGLTFDMVFGAVFGICRCGHRIPSQYSGRTLPVVGMHSFGLFNSAAVAFSASGNGKWLMIGVGARILVFSSHDCQHDDVAPKLLQK